MAKAQTAKRPASSGKSSASRSKVSAKPTAKKTPVPKKPAAAQKPAAKAKPAAAKKPVSKAKPAVKAMPVMKALVTKAKAAVKAPAKPSAPAVKATKKSAPPALAKTPKPTTSRTVTASASALEPKPGVVASRKPTTTIVKKKTTTRMAHVDDQTDRYEAAKPATAVYERAKATPVAQTGADGSKSPFGISELKTWRAILMQKRSELTNDINDLRKDAMDAEDGHTTPNHLAERGSDADLQDISLGMADQEETILLQIDRALRKIGSGRPIAYGLCEHTSEPIALSRLELMPWTPLSIQGAEYMEASHLTVEDMLIED